MKQDVLSTIFVFGIRPISSLFRSSLIIIHIPVEKYCLFVYKLWINIPALCQLFYKINDNILRYANKICIF